MSTMTTVQAPPAMPVTPSLQHGATADDDAGASARADAGTVTQPVADASNASTHCKAGVYAGTFTGSIQVVGLSLSSVTGTVRAKLVYDSAKNTLDVHEGRVMGVDQDGNRLTCDLSGSINCGNDELEAGKLDHGIFHNVESDTDTAFVGTLQGTYAQDPHSVVGTWRVEAQDTSLLGGRGTWTLVRNE
jgi:hypothetical protein